MVRLVMTAAIVAAVETYTILHLEASLSDDNTDPSLEKPAVGNPIAHGQIIAISKHLRAHDKLLEDGKRLSLSATGSYHLDDLLRGSRVYYDPPKPKPEPSSEYKALMARLRREEEDRAYERMIEPPAPIETFAQRFPNSQHLNLFPTSKEDVGEDEEITYADVNRQMALIINVLVSIIACSIALWMVASHWSTPKRLSLSMGGSSMVGAAEVVVYAGYIRRLKEARERGRKKIEIKEIIKSWVIGGAEKEDEYAPKAIEMSDTKAEKVRRRRVR